MDGQNCLFVKVTVHKVKDSSVDPQLKVRLFSEWTNCSCTSAAFGVDELPWMDSDEFNQESTFQATVDCDMSSEEKLGVLNAKPGIYVVYVCNDEPVGFTYLDCSSFLVEAGQSAVRNSKVFGYNVNISAECHAPLLPLEKCIKFEPVVLEMKR